MNSYITALILSIILLTPSLHANELTFTWTSETDTPEYRMSIYGGYFRISGAPNTGRVGDPSLPAAPVYAVLPHGAVVDSIVIIESESKQLTGTFDLKPIQHGVPISRPEDFQPVQPNPEAFQTTLNLPKASVTGQGTLLGYNIVNLIMRPIEWNPQTGTAIFTNSMTITVYYHLEATGTVPVGRGEVGSIFAEETVESFVINPRDAALYSPPVCRNFDLDWGEYLIVTPDSLVEVFEQLAQFKTMKGIQTNIVTTEYISTNYTGVDEAQKLRFFLGDIYGGTPPTFILLGGDTPLVPHRNCWATAEGYMGDPAADIYFQDMNDTAPGADNWDANTDGVWGEIGVDNMDYHPDYIIGRASVQTGAEANIFVNKVLTYENYTQDDLTDTQPWNISMGFTTSILWSSPYCPGSAGKEKVDTLYTPVEWHPITKLYESTGSQSYSESMAMLNFGMQLVNHAGHGSETSIAIGSWIYLTTSDFMGLTNISANDRVSIFNTIACNCGGFDISTCLAEAWIRSPNGGGFCMMNTRYGWGEPSEPGDKWSELVDQEFFSKFFTEDLYRLGQAHSMAWNEFIALIPVDTHYDWIAKSITLFGDPELPMRLEEPNGNLNIDAPDFITHGSNTFTVTLTDDGGPVENARICILQGEWDAPELYEIGLTDAAGQLTMNFTVEDGADTAAFTVWCRNRAPVTSDLSVSTGISTAGSTADNFTLSSPCPNPATASVSFNWTVSAIPGQLEIFDLSGRVIAVIGTELEGEGTTCWNMRTDDNNSVPPGMYFARLTSGSMVSIKRMVILR